MNADLAKTFGANVQRRRKQLGLTQDNLAELLGIGQHSLSRIERGVLTPKFDRLSIFPNICTVLFLHFFRVMKVIPRSTP